MPSTVTPAADRLLHHISHCMECRIAKAFRQVNNCATRAQLVRQTLDERHGERSH